MLKILQHFEEMAAGAALLPFAIIGAALVLVGLIIWLGGLHFSRFIATLVGAATGIVAGLPFVSNWSHVAIAAMIGAVVGALLNKYMMIIFAAVVVAGVGMIISVGPQLADSDFGIDEHSHGNNGKSRLSVMLSEIPKLLINYADEVWLAIKDTATAGAFTVSVAAGLGVLVVGIFGPRLVSAGACATIGMVIIFIGMVMMLQYKGSKPVTRIIDNVNLYIIVAVGMMLFGTFTQMVLCKSAKKNKSTKKDGDK